MYDITIMISIGNTVFTKTCETASEAFDAWRDAWTGLYKEVLKAEEQDRMMDCLLRMKRGTLLSTENRQIRIVCVEHKEE